MARLYAERSANGVCVRCGLTRDRDGSTCVKCNSVQMSRQSKRRLERAEVGLCVACGKSPSNQECTQCIDARAERRLRVKLEVFAAYGGATCRCCGESMIDFLTIDHIANDGAQHRREIGIGGTTLYSWLRSNKYPSGFQVLCSNCNQSKAVHGICRHEMMRKSASQLFDGS